MMLSSAMAGTYAPPAVHEPITMAIWNVTVALSKPQTMVSARDAESVWTRARRARARWRYLGDARRRHGCLVEENAPKVVLVRKDAGLVGKVGTARVHYRGRRRERAHATRHGQPACWPVTLASRAIPGRVAALASCARGRTEVDARQAVFTRDLLGPQVLLDGNGVVRAALDRGVVGDDHRLDAVGDAACRVHVVFVSCVVRGQCTRGHDATHPLTRPMPVMMPPAGTLSLYSW